MEFGDKIMQLYKEVEEGVRSDPKNRPPTLPEIATELGSNLAIAKAFSLEGNTALQVANDMVVEKYKGYGYKVNPLLLVRTTLIEDGERGDIFSFGSGFSDQLMAKWWGKHSPFKVVCEPGGKLCIEVGYKACPRPTSAFKRQGWASG
jgi:hypothetical protein